MTRRVPGVLWLGLALACVPATRLHASDGAPRVDRALEAMRREAEDAAAKRELAFKRLAEMAAPPVDVARLERQFGAVLRRVDRGRIAGPLIVPGADRLLDELAPAGDEEPRFEFADESFDLQVLGTTGDDQSAREYLGMLLEARVRDLGRSQPLTASQRKRLLLAGRGDIKRLFDRIEDARRTFQGLKSDLERCAAFLNELHPLSRELRRGPFGPESLLVKTLRTIREHDGQLAGQPH